MQLLVFHETFALVVNSLPGAGPRGGLSPADGGDIFWLSELKQKMIHAQVHNSEAA